MADLEGEGPARDSARQGQIAQRRGKELEAWCADRLLACQQAGVVAYVQHSEPSWRQAGYRPGPQGKREPVFVRAEASGADFFGVLEPKWIPAVTPSRPFAIECKAVAADDRLRHRGAFFHQSGKRKGQPKRQLLHLQALQRSLSPAYLLVGFYDEREQWARFLLPWATVPWATLRDSLTLGCSDIERAGWAADNAESFRATLVEAG